MGKKNLRKKKKKKNNAKIVSMHTQEFQPYQLAMNYIL